MGLTWYPNDNPRFMLNDSKALQMERQDHVYDGVELGIVLLRTQVIW